jgi:activator of HSP90 ATPase
MSLNIEASCTYFVPAKVLYEAFLDSRELSRMTLSASTISPTIGGQFSMFNGGVTGEIVELVPNERICEKWRFSQWEDNVYSDLELSFVRLGDCKTQLRVVQRNIPERDRHGNPHQETMVLNGWKEKFFMTLEKVLGFGVDRD